MRIKLDTPVGALTRPQVEAMARIPGSIIYKVYLPEYQEAFKLYLPKYQEGIIKLCVAEYIEAKAEIYGREGHGYSICRINAWYSAEPMGYLFDNYFHALAHAMKLKGAKDDEAA